MNKIAILTVDDEKIILDSIRNQLEKNFGQKYQLEFAESAIEALEIADFIIQDGVTILLIISDYQMHGMKGDEFARILKNKYQKINIVILTGHMATQKSQELLDSNIILKTISKPWQEKDLVDLINNLAN